MPPRLPVDKERILSNISVNKDTGCWEWTGTKGWTGYGQISANGVCNRAHRVAYELFKGEIQSGMCVCHTCDNPGCCNPEHLWLGTPADNAGDRERKGRGVTRKGENHCMAKLTEANVYGILALLASGQYSLAWIAKFYVVSSSAIGHIKNNTTWSHIDRGQFAWD